MTGPTAQVHDERMAKAWTITGALFLLLEAGLAGFGVLVHYGFTAEYGNINESALEGLISGFTQGVGAIALFLVVAVAGLVFIATPLRWMRWAAVLLPVGMVVGMLAVTPMALGHKLDRQYDATPQCALPDEEGELGPSPYLRAACESERAYESIEHIVQFGGGGSSGVGGCDDVDVLEHYRTALPAAGWRVVEDDGGHLRAERDRMAFELALCRREGGVVWAGRQASGGGAHCHDDGMVGGDTEAQGPGATGAHWPASVSPQDVRKLSTATSGAPRHSAGPTGASPSQRLPTTRG